MPGNLEASELIYRTSLPPDDEAFMPAEGKTPLTAEQVEILRWWVGAGAPRATMIEAIGTPRELEPLLAAQLGLGGPCGGCVSGRERHGRSATRRRLICCGIVGAAGVAERFTTVVSVNSPGTALSTAALAALNAAAAEIVDLNLADAAFDDAGLAAIGDLGAATHLRFARNRLTDGGIASLAALPQLAHLNLYGNGGVTDAGLAMLATSGSLRELYVWQTAASAEGVARLRAQRPELVVDFGAESTAAAR